MAPAPDPATAPQPETAPAAAPQPETAPVVSSAPVSFAFGWRAGDEAVVTETTKKQGRNSTTRYTITVDADGDNLLIAYRDFDIIALDAVDMNDPSVKAMIKSAAQQAAAQLPPFGVTQQGQWRGFDDPDDLLRRIETLLEKDSVAVFRKTMANPQMRQLVMNKLEDVWNTWVATWIGLNTERGERYETTVSIPIGEQPVDAKCTIVVRDVDRGRRVAVQMITHLEGPQANVAMGKVLATMAASATEDPAKRAEIEEMFENVTFERHTTVDVVTDPATLRPDKVSTVSKVTVVAQNEKRVQTESKSWAFEWKDNKRAGQSPFRSPYTAR